MLLNDDGMCLKKGRLASRQHVRVFQNRLRSLNATILRLSIAHSPLPSAQEDDDAKQLPL